MSLTQQHYYIRRATETVVPALSVITPSPEELVWEALHLEAHLDTNRDNQGKHKRLNPSSGLLDILVKAYQQAGHWQTKRQILFLFADDFSRADFHEMIPGLSKWRIDQARQHATEARKGHYLKFLIFLQELTTKKWIILLNLSPDQNLSRTWHSGQKLSILTQERRLSCQQLLGPSSLHASSNNI